MKEYFASTLRHLFTFLIAAGTVLAQKGIIAPEDADAVNAQGLTIRDGVVAVAMIILSRLVLKYGGKIFSANAAEDVGTKTKGSDGAGYGSLLLLLSLAGLIGFSLPSCAPMDNDTAIRMHLGYLDRHGNTYGYSSKSGIEVQIRESK